MVYQTMWALILLGLVALIVLCIPSKRKNPKAKQKFPVLPVALLAIAALIFAYTYRAVHEVDTCTGDWCELGILFYGSGATAGLTILALVMAVISKFRKK